MSISTKRGDTGFTSLLGGKRVTKTHPRVWAYGTVDELNSALGLVRAAITVPKEKDFIRNIQGKLIFLMGELATDNASLPQHTIKYKDSIINEDDVALLGDRVEQIESTQGGFSGWIYPGESELEARYDIARTTCRRAERYVLRLIDNGGEVRPVVIQYLNRLSDLLWLMGREACQTSEPSNTSD